MYVVVIEVVVRGGVFIFDVIVFVYVILMYDVFFERFERLVG